ncbi:MAG: hypothetical protein GX621_13565 [Pirellulaceae bacterium]|nr:hypothetical protein [Pirellulaceae bacterium]
MQHRIRSILEDLEAVRENLLALSDDIWLSIDHNDSESLDEGVQFKRLYNEKMAAFDTLASELSTMVQQFTSVRLESAEQSGGEDESENVRIVQELNREEPHAISEDFTYKRPHGFILDGQGTTGITTWRRLYELLCQQLLRRDGDRFHALADNPDYISNRGHHAFTRDPAHLRHASPVEDGFYTEVNLSANSIRDTIRRLLATFEIPEDRLQLFLRQDRDAGNLPEP